MDKTMGTSPVSFPIKLRSTEDVIIDSFNLSAEELLEIEVMAKMFKNNRYLELDELASTTSNTGVQYLMLDKGYLVSKVLNNKNVNSEVIVHFFLRVQAMRIKKYPFDISGAFHDLARNEVVVSDMRLFEQLWSTAEVLKPNVASASTVADDFLLYASLNEHSIARGGKALAMPISTLLFILALISKRDAASVNRDLTELCETILEDRREEIRAWVEVNMPDYVDLPLTWVYEVFDLYISDDEVVG